jgi:hypothetical protein
MDYVYQEYPKCLYHPNGLTMEVLSEEAEVAMAELGWLTADQFHASETSDAPQAHASEAPVIAQRKSRR